MQTGGESSGQETGTGSWGFIALLIRNWNKVLFGGHIQI